MSRPKISYHLCETSTRVKNTTATDAHMINKVIKYIKNSPSHITIPKSDLNSLEIQLYSDASFNNLPDGGSQGGQVVFLCHQYQNLVPITWSSTTIKHVTQSTLAAETLSLVDSCDTAYFIANPVSDLIQVQKIPIYAFTNNQSLHDSINTTKATTDRCLRVEISALREMYDKNEITTNWLSKHHQLSNILTKKGTPYHRLIKVLQKGRIEF